MIHEVINLIDVGIILFAGMVGGLANSFLTAEEWKSVLIPNLVLGGVAALLLYFLGGSELDPMRQIGTALLAGLGGGNLLTSLRQRLLLRLQEQKEQDLGETSEEVVDLLKHVTEALRERRNHDDANNQRNTSKN